MSGDTLSTLIERADELLSNQEGFEANAVASIASKKAEVDTFVLGAENTINGQKTMYVDPDNTTTTEEGTSSNPFTDPMSAINAIVQGKHNEIRLADENVYFEGLTSLNIVYLEDNTTVSFVRWANGASHSRLKIPYVVSASGTFARPALAFKGRTSANIKVSGYDLELEVFNDTGLDSVHYEHFVSGSYGTDVKFKWFHEDVFIPEGLAICATYVLCGNLSIDVGYLELKGDGTLVSDYTHQSNFVVRGAGLTTDGVSAVFESEPVSLQTNITNAALLFKTV